MRQKQAPVSGAAPNTIKLRQVYNQYAIDANDRGEPLMSFEDWARTNYPDMPILKP
jgi:hypothetical protein